MFDGADIDVYTNYSSYVSCKLGKLLLEACEYCERTLKRSDMFRGSVMEQAKKWASITDEEIGVASHPHFMNPRVTASQTGMIVPDAIRLKRAAKDKQMKEQRERNEATKKRKAALRKARATASKAASSHKRKMTRSEAGRHGAWCKMMQSWGAMKRKRWEIADDIMLTIIYNCVTNITKLVCSSSFAYLCILSLKHLKKEEEAGN